MEQLTKGAKLLTRFVARDRREGFLEVEAEMNRLADVVDGFYERLGARNWVFHDLLSVNAIETLLEETNSPEESERRLIEMYRDPESGTLWATRLSSFEGLRARSMQIERALQHYHDDQFDSCVLHLVAIMDGFVNDFEPDARKGLAAREPLSMTAWDSVVNHHMGLTHALETFKRPIKKRVDEEVKEVYRHGIMHGSVVNFDNVVVATKAWNLLYAVSDWASAKDNAAKPEPERPSFRELVSKVERSGRYKRTQKHFEQREIDLQSPAPEDEAPANAARGFLKAWEQGRWSEVVEYQPRQLRGVRRTGELARDAKSTFTSYRLSESEIVSMHRDMISTIAVRASGVVEGERRDFVFRMVGYTADNRLCMPGEEDVDWTVCTWAPQRWFEDADTQNR